MYHPSRGGVRGGADQFDWEDVKSDKNRECYLGKFVQFVIEQLNQFIFTKSKTKLKVAFICFEGECVSINIRRRMN